MSKFNANDWYWFVGGNTTQAYSSARNIYVPTSDSAYVSWTQSNSANPIGSEIDLWYYMQSLLPAWLFNGTTFSQPAVGQYTKTQLIAYAGNVRYTTENEGTIAAGVPVDTSDRGKMLINSARWACDGNPAFTTIWVGTDGQHYPVTQPQMIEINTVVTNRTEKCYQTYDGVVANINNLVITALADIDSAFSGIA